MSIYARNKAKAVFINTKPTKTDQSQAHDTDINVIVKRYGITGTAPGATHQPIYEDFSELPRDLRSMIEESRSVARLRRQLPQPLREIPVAELVTMTPEQIQAKLDTVKHDYDKTNKPKDEPK